MARSMRKTEKLSHPITTTESQSGQLVLTRLLKDTLFSYGKHGLTHSEITT